MKICRLLFTILFLELVMVGCKQSVKPDAEAPGVSTPDAKLIATVHNSGFENAHDTYNGISSASDGKIYYVLNSHLIDVAGQMFSFDPKTGKIEHLG